MRAPPIFGGAFCVVSDSCLPTDRQETLRQSAAQVRAYLMGRRHMLFVGMVLNICTKFFRYVQQGVEFGGGL